jgi:hypothetical protein
MGIKAILKAIRQALQKPTTERGGVLEIDFNAAHGLEEEIRRQAIAQGKTGPVILVPRLLSPEEWDRASALSKG